MVLVENEIKQGGNVLSYMHHNMAREAADVMLFNWKQPGGWKNDIVSHNVYLSHSKSAFPSPDGVFYDPDYKRSIAIEFKPPTESKRGILTGLGQSIAYLNEYSMSYLICPEYVEGFKVDLFISSILNKHSLNKKVPLGLISYNAEDMRKMKIISEINVSDTDIKQYGDNSSNRFWAKYVDITPHLLWLLLDTAYNLKDMGNRKDTVWKIFFDEYYYPKKYRGKLELFDSDILMWDNKPSHPFGDTIKDQIRRVDEGLVSYREAVELINQRIASESKDDNLYKSFRKNYFPFIDHLGLWDDQAYLSETGYELHKCGKLNGANSKAFKDKLSKIILIDGKHLDLIIDIEELTRNQSLDNSQKARKYVFSELEKKGLIKRNPNRSTTVGSTKNLSNEFQLWNHMGIVRLIGGTFFTCNSGFNFDWGEITRLIG